MCKLEYNQYVKSRIDSLIDAVFELRPTQSLVVECKSDHRIVIRTQMWLEPFSARPMRVADKCDAELDSMGVL